MRRNEENEPICHKCIFGIDTSEGCQCPRLSNDVWTYFEKTEENTKAYEAACAVARHKVIEGKIPKDFTPIPFVAVVSAVANGECKYLQENAHR